MNKHEGDYRGFYIHSESWYERTAQGGRNFDEEIMLGFYSPGGGTSGEFAIRWKKVGEHSAARLEVFHDAWEALSHFGDLLNELTTLDDTRPPPATVIEILRRLGIQDRTERVNPNPAKPAICTGCLRPLPDQVRGES